PTVVGWRSDRGWRNVDHLHHGSPDFADGAEKYEGGMVNFPSLYAMGEAVQMILEIGPEQIEQRVLESAEKCAEILEAAGGEITYRGSPILAARFEGVDAPTLAQGLKKDGVFVSARHGRLRVSTHFYNNSDDLQRLREGLHKQISGAKI
ncbi:MAG: aminotransferase class V-fold PLP-dependent enzyme, partial [Bryobacteraceae bacterium]|nr:aminotransferase class V-fold PLP-dependent enzyme [Bryobacteraceae bacterium]